MLFMLVYRCQRRSKRHSLRLKRDFLFCHTIMHSYRPERWDLFLLHFDCSFFSKACLTFLYQYPNAAYTLFYSATIDFATLDPVG